jgi:hypothetical protein
MLHIVVMIRPHRADYHRLMIAAYEGSIVEMQRLERDG